MTKSCLKWIGGKQKHVDKYINLMPKHSLFVSPFAGGCHVELAKPKTGIEIINDKNDQLINFLEVLQKRPQELYEACAALPYSETLYNTYKWENLSEDQLEQAVRFFYIVRAGFSGGGHKYKTGFSVSQTVDKAQTYKTSVGLIAAMAQRIKDWNILCRDFQDVIEKYDSPNTFFFCDPPYVDCEDLYAGDFKREDHYRLRETISQIEGKVIICYYDHPLIRELYPVDECYVYEFKTRSKIQQRDFGDQCPTRTELILMNYQPPRLSQLSLM